MLDKGVEPLHSRLNKGDTGAGASFPADESGEAGLTSTRRSTTGLGSLFE